MLVTSLCEFVGVRHVGSQGIPAGSWGTRSARDSKHVLLSMYIHIYLCPYTCIYMYIYVYVDLSPYICMVLYKIWRYNHCLFLLTRSHACLTNHWTGSPTQRLSIQPSIPTIDRPTDRPGQWPQIREAFKSCDIHR